MITKSSYLKGRQCLKRQWLAVHGVAEPDIESEEVWQERLRGGAHVESYAELLFPGGRPITPPADDGDAGPTTRQEGLRATREAITGNIPIFQAHFEHDDLFAVADILEPRGGGWFLWEVKASTNSSGTWKPVFDWDLAFQVNLARNSGLTVVGCGVIHLSHLYVLVAGEIDPNELLVRVDRSEAVEELLPDVESDLAAMREVLGHDAFPVELPGARCKASRTAQAGDRASACGHITDAGECGRHLPQNWAGRLPRLSGAKEQQINGVPNQRIEDLDPDHLDLNWTEIQIRVIETVQSGHPFVDAAALNAKLGQVEWPVAYLDFEFDPGVAVPTFEGCRPYDRIPFQWAMVVQPSEGAALDHPLGFLHLDETDPSRAFAESLIDAVPETGSLVAHHASAETSVLQRLAERLGGNLGEALEALVPRFADTERIARAGYYHHEQQGSWSIKKLAPALIGRGYDDLEINDGMAAVVAWRRAIRAQGEERERLGGELERYCGRDAELMHGILQELRRQSGP